MLGYKVYYNNQKFMVEQNLSEVKMCYNGMNRWFDTLDRAQEVSEKLNKHLKQDITKVYDDKDFIIQKCNNCGEYFMFFGEDKKWFSFKNIPFPKNCKTCRKKIKTKYSNIF